MLSAFNKLFIALDEQIRKCLGASAETSITYSGAIWLAGKLVEPTAYTCTYDEYLKNLQTPPAERSKNK
jgi:hypothetical protein